VRWWRDIFGEGKRAFVKDNVTGYDRAVGVAIKTNIPFVVWGIAEEDT
jgi:hypothetical protein